MCVMYTLIQPWWYIFDISGTQAGILSMRMPVESPVFPIVFPIRASVVLRQRLSPQAATAIVARSLRQLKLRPAQVFEHCSWCRPASSNHVFHRSDIRVNYTTHTKHQRKVSKKTNKEWKKERYEINKTPVWSNLLISIFWDHQINTDLWKTVSNYREPINRSLPERLHSPFSLQLHDHICTSGVRGERRQVLVMFSYFKMKK